MQEKINKTSRFLLNLRHLVNKTGLLDCEIAERLGIHKVSFSRYFTEQRIPKRTILEKISTYFSVSTTDLLNKDLTQEQKATTPAATELPLSNQISGLLDLPADLPPEFQKKVEAKLTALQQQINNTVCELLNEFAKLHLDK